jgi:hypothetical protein
MQAHLLLPTFVASAFHGLPSLLLAILNIINIIHTSGGAVEPRHTNIPLPGMARAIRGDDR